MSGGHAIVVDHCVHHGLRAVAGDPLDTTHHLPGILLDPRCIRLVPRNIGLPPAATSVRRRGVSGPADLTATMPDRSTGMRGKAV
jgi:hypothetical protein